MTRASGAGAIDLAAAGVLAVVDPANEETRLGRYQLHYRVGGGGMAEVFLARDIGPGGIDRWVAIKRLLPQLVSEEKALHMLVDEARLSARIAHPNVAQLIDIGESEGTPFLVMEYLHGEPLSSVLRRIRKTKELPDIDLMMRVVANACEGAHAAHELRGPDGRRAHLVHRDLSPQNLFVTYDGFVKVVDFGIAKAKGRLIVTEVGTLKGKFAYMSPEQALGKKDVDRRSDVFSLGIVLWEATTGRRMFEGESDLEALRRIQDGDLPRPSRHRAAYPPDLEEVVTKSLARRREDRYATARDMADALERLLVERRALTSPARISAVMHDLFGDRIAQRDALLSARVPPGELPSTVELVSGETVSTLAERVSSVPAVYVPWGSRLGAIAVFVLVIAVVLAFATWGVLWLLGPAPEVVADEAPRVLERASEPRPLPQVPTADPVTPAAGAPGAEAPGEQSEAGDEQEAEPAGDGAQGAAGRRPRPARVGKGGGAPTWEELLAERDRAIVGTGGQPSQPGSARIGLLNVQSHPWAWVHLDGRRIRRTPIVGLEVGAGRHTVRLVTEDGRTKDVRIDVPAGGSASVNESF